VEDYFPSPKSSKKQAFATRKQVVNLKSLNTAWLRDLP
jgi:hypothetical protein